MMKNENDDGEEDEEGEHRGQHRAYGEWTGCEAKARGTKVEKREKKWGVLVLMKTMHAFSIDWGSFENWAFFFFSLF